MSAMEIADVYLHGESPIIIDNQLDLIMYLRIQILSTLHCEGVMDVEYRWML